MVLFCVYKVHDKMLLLKLCPLGAFSPALSFMITPKEAYRSCYLFLICNHILSQLIYNLNGHFAPFLKCSYVQARVERRATVLKTIDFWCTSLSGDMFKVFCCIMGRYNVNLFFLCYKSFSKFSIT